MCGAHAAALGSDVLFSQEHVCRISISSQMNSADLRLGFGQGAQIRVLLIFCVIMFPFHALAFFLSTTD